jgi:hypothetical protein
MNYTDQIKARKRNLESDLNFQKEEINKRLEYGKDISHALEYMAMLHLKIETLDHYWPSQPRPDTNQLLKG